MEEPTLYRRFCQVVWQTGLILVLRCFYAFVGRIRPISCPATCIEESLHRRCPEILRFIKGRGRTEFLVARRVLIRSSNYREDLCSSSYQRISCRFPGTSSLSLGCPTYQGFGDDHQKIAKRYEFVSLNLQHIFLHSEFVAATFSRRIEKQNFRGKLFPSLKKT